jgi:probable phosphoglycerate mutase
MMPPLSRSTTEAIAKPLSLTFVRHGATQPNLDGLRCGGDLDHPMVALGRRQILEVAQSFKRTAWPIDLIVASDLHRTCEAAHIISGALGGVPIQIDTGWRERAMGEWNLRPIAENDDALRAGHTPPGGETSAAFSTRVGHALQRCFAAAHARFPLLVASKGVARVLFELLDRRLSSSVGNGETLQFDLAALVGASTRASQIVRHGPCPNVRAARVDGVTT